MTAINETIEIKEFTDRGVIINEGMGYEVVKKLKVRICDGLSRVKLESVEVDGSRLINHIQGENELVNNKKTLKKLRF